MASCCCFGRGSRSPRSPSRSSGSGNLLEGTSGDFLSSDARSRSNAFQEIAPQSAASTSSSNDACSGSNAFQDIAPQSTASTFSSKEPCYDVFINHHGKDVKHTLASTIYNMLDVMGVPVFLDQEELEVGDSFPPAIEEAMRSASVHIAVFSPNYARSAWCLEELSLMLQINVAIIPVFYGVDPSDLRHVAKGRYADAFDAHRRKGRYRLEKIEKWEKALNRISYVNGCMLNADKDEGKLLRKIVDSACHRRKKVPLNVVRLNVATFPVGLDEAVQDFETTVGSSFSSKNVRIFAIVGMGGSGKTTLAKELYNRKCSSVSRSCFLPNVRHAASNNTLPNLQKILLKSLGINHSEFCYIDEGKGFLEKDLRSMSVLIVLDDVDNADQMVALLPKPDNLGQGSFIIVTTRERGVLPTRGIINYAMKLLDPFDASQLFCKHAFLCPYSQHGLERLNENYHNFKDLIKRFVEACKGLPLSLKVFGAMVNGKPKSYWESELEKISRILPNEIADCLKLSYEALDGEVKQMFLDIACFFLGKEKSLAIAIWDRSGWSGDVGWETLVNKCLVALNEKDCIEMHDHLRDLGRRTAEDLSPSRICKGEQISNNQIVRAQIRGIVFDGNRDYWPTLERCMEKIRPSLPALLLLAVSGDDVREEFWALSKDLVWLCVHDFHDTSLPSWLSLGNLTVLELYNPANLENLWQDNAQLPLQLRVLIIHMHSPSVRVLLLLTDHLNKLTKLCKLALRHIILTALPDSLGNLSNLRTLHLRGNQLTALPDSLGNLNNLQTLHLPENQLMALPDSLGNLSTLQTLHLGENQLTALPDSLGNLSNLQTLHLGENQLTALPDSLGNLSNLQTLHLRENQLTTLPDSLGNLSNLQTLDVGGNQLTALPDSLGNLSNLQTLVLWGNQLTALPDSLGNLSNLQTLDVGGNRLTALPDSLGNLSTLQTLHMWANRLTALRDSLGNLSNLQTLHLGGNQLTALPDSLGNLSNLQTLHLGGNQLTALRDSVGNLSNLQTLDLRGNQLTALRDSLGNLSNLQTLDLRGNQLTALPDSLGNLSNLETLFRDSYCY